MRRQPSTYTDDEVEGAVLAYLRSHPRAADTLDGIVDWWLPLQRFETARIRIERTLDRLVTAGTLRRDRLRDGAVLYALRSEPPSLRSSPPRL